MKNGVYKRKSFAVLIVVIAILAAFGCGVFVRTTSKKQMKKKENKVVTLRLTGDGIDWIGKQNGWFADLLLERFGCKLDIRPAMEYSDPLKEADIILWGGIAEPDYVKKSSDLTNVKKKRGGRFCLAVNAHSKHKDLANRFVDYLDSPKGMMEMLYGPEKSCWYYKDGKAYLTNNGYSYMENTSLMYPAKKAKQESFAMGYPRFMFLPYTSSMLDPNTGEAYDILQVNKRRLETEKETEQPKNNLKICSNVKKMQVKYVGVNMDEMGTKDLDSAQIATVKKYFDRMSLKKKTYKKGKSPKDIQKESIVYTMQGGKYKEVVYYPFNQFAVSLDGTWYSVTTDQDNPEPINDPADAFLIGTQKTGTHFYIYGNDYDISKQDANVEYIEEGISAGRYVVVKCHLKKGKCNEYFIYDRIKRAFIYKFTGNYFTWYQNDIMHGYYVDQNTIYSYDGTVFQKTDCKEDERIVYLEQKSKKKLEYSIASWSTGEIRESKYDLVQKTAQE